MSDESQEDQKIVVPGGFVDSTGPFVLGGLIDLLNRYAEALSDELRRNPVRVARDGISYWVGEDDT